MGIKSFFYLDPTSRGLFALPSQVFCIVNPDSANFLESSHGDAHSFAIPKLFHIVHTYCFYDHFLQSKLTQKTIKHPSHKTYIRNGNCVMQMLQIPIQNNANTPLQNTRWHLCLIMVPYLLLVRGKGHRGRLAQTIPQWDNATSSSGYVESWKVTWSLSSSQKARRSKRLIPSPPVFTGLVACNQEGSV